MQHESRKTIWGEKRARGKGKREKRMAGGECEHSKLARVCESIVKSSILY